MNIIYPCVNLPDHDLSLLLFELFGLGAGLFPKCQQFERKVGLFGRVANVETWELRELDRVLNKK